MLEDGLERVDQFFLDVYGSGGMPFGVVLWFSGVVWVVPGGDVFGCLRCVVKCPAVGL